MKHAPANHSPFLILMLVYMEHEDHFVLKLFKLILFLIRFDSFERFLSGSAVSVFCFSQEKIPDRIPDITQKKRKKKRKENILLAATYLAYACVHPLKSTLDNHETAYYSVETFKSAVVVSVYCDGSARCMLGVN